MRAITPRPPREHRSSPRPSPRTAGHAALSGITQTRRCIPRSRHNRALIFRLF